MLLITLPDLAHATAAEQTDDAIALGQDIACGKAGFRRQICESFPTF
jgi:hypothetical protein